jgi:hypothetical protein
MVAALAAAGAAVVAANHSGGPLSW